MQEVLARMVGLALLPLFEQGPPHNAQAAAATAAAAAAAAPSCARPPLITAAELGPGGLGWVTAAAVPELAQALREPPIVLQRPPARPAGIRGGKHAAAAAAAGAAAAGDAVPPPFRAQAAFAAVAAPAPAPEDGSVDVAPMVSDWHCKSLGVEGRPAGPAAWIPRP